MPSMTRGPLPGEAATPPDLTLPPLSRWARVGIAFCVLVGVAGAGLWVLGLLVYANHDRPEFIDDPAVGQTMTAACRDMTVAADRAAAAPSSSVPVRVRAIRRQDQAMLDMVTRVRRLGHERLANDDPALPWLKDWETLVAARERYAQELASGGHPRLSIPTVNGTPITRRMSELVGVSCRVPRSVTTSS